MDNALRQMAMAAREMRMENPFAVPIHPGTALQAMLVDSKRQEAYDYDDLLEAARMAGVAEQDLDAFIEELASWL